MGYQFYVIDSLIKLSFVFMFNGRLIRLISMQRDDLSSCQSVSVSSSDLEVSKRESIAIAKQMNNRQTELLETISKHSLLICLMVSGNVIWSVWIAVPYGDNNGMGSVISSYIFMFVN